MTASLAEASTALGAALDTIAGLRVIDHPTDSYNPPCAVIEPNRVDYHGAFSTGLVTYTFTVTVLVARTVDRLVLDRIDPYIAPTGASSVKAVVESDQTLGGVVQAVKVGSAAQIVTYQTADASYFGGQIEVTIYA